jgi:hypothetical protein
MCVNPNVKTTHKQKVVARLTLLWHDSSHGAALTAPKEMKMDKIGTVVDRWTGRDGNEWRGVRLEGGGYLVQRCIGLGIWL